MKKEMRANRRRAAVLAALLGVSLALSACGPGKGGRPVIAEKTSGEAETGGEGENGPAEDGGSGGKQLLDLLELPDRYEARVETEKLSLSCDAAIQVPENAAMKEALVRRRPYSEEEYGEYAQAAAKAAGTAWDEATRRQDGTAVDMDSEDGRYLLSFVSGGEDRLPIFWVTSYERYGGKQLSGEEVLREVSEEEKAALEEQLGQRAAELREALSAEEFAMEEPQWRAAESRDGEESGLGITFLFRRTWDGVTIMKQEMALFGEPAASVQYISITFAADGELLEVKAVGRESIEDGGQEDVFFLPFAAVAEVFEQYCRVYYEDESHTPLPAGLLEKQDPADGGTVLTAVNVSRVCLEYRYEAEKEDGITAPEGILIPVWNFYGTGTVGWDPGPRGGGNRELLDGEEFLLVSIGAEDGMVYGN